MQHGPGTIYAGFPSSLGFGVGGQSYSKFLAPTVNWSGRMPYMPHSHQYNIGMLSNQLAAFSGRLLKLVSQNALFL